MVNYPQVDHLVSQGLTVEEACAQLGLSESEKASVLAVVRPKSPEEFKDRVRALQNKAIDTLASIMQGGEPAEQLKAAEIAFKAPIVDTGKDETAKQLMRDKALQQRLLEIESAEASEEAKAKEIVFPALQQA